MVDISCAFATSMDTPDHVAVAEQLGYRRAWLYDSPALYSDVWMMLGECARRTTTIEIGPGVAVPSLRHLKSVAPKRPVVGGAYKVRPEREREVRCDAIGGDGSVFVV